MKNKNIGDLYNENFRLVYKYLICLTHDKDIAEDLAQDTFCKAIAKINTFKGNSKVSVWLCEIAKNLWLNELKKKKRSVLVENPEELVDVKYNVEDDFLLKQDNIELHKKIHNLAPNVKEIFYLKLFANLTFKEIGEIIGKSEVWVRVNFYRGKEKIKESEKNEQEM